MRKLKNLYLRFERIEFRAKCFLVGSKRKIARKIFGDMTVISVKNNFDSSNPRVAILGLFPASNEIYLYSLQNLLDGLKVNRTQIIAVSNKQLEKEMINLLEKYNATVIVRKNQGRDFGAYQCGLLWLNKERLLGNVKRLFFINDTLLWLNSSRDVLEGTSKYDWQSIYLNLERNVHAHSFYLSFSEKIIQSEGFLKFWEAYSPQDSRHHAIHKGENELSNILLISGFTCKPLVTPEFLQSAYKKVLKSPSLIRRVKNTPIGDLYPGTPPHSGKAGKTFPDYKSNDLVINELATFVYSDAPHRLGLILHLLSEVPLKVDLFKFYSVSEIASTVKQARNVQLVADFYALKAQQFQKSDSLTIKLRRLGEI
jgi:lipopolysaccharide biosynthesis protein